MRPLKTAPVLVLLVSLLGLPQAGLAGCSTANKVKRTLALSDLQIQAGVAEERGDDQRAYELWSEYVDRRPQSDWAEYRLGMVETRLGKYEEAISHLRVAHDLKPGNIEYIDALAAVLVKTGNNEMLMSVLRDSAGEGDKGSGYLRLAHYAQQAGMLDEAREALEMAIVQGRGESAAPYLAMADFSRTIGNEEMEIQNLRYALWFNPADPSVLSRFERFDMVPGPSLALKPAY